VGQFWAIVNNMSSLGFVTSLLFKNSRRQKLGDNDNFSTGAKYLQNAKPLAIKGTKRRNYFIENYQHLNLHGVLPMKVQRQNLPLVYFFDQSLRDAGVAASLNS
jgi:hypothetical protein